MKVYTGSAWVEGYSGSSTFLAVANNLSDLNNTSIARTNLGVAIGSDVQAYSSVLDATTASFTTADETKLDGIETGADVTDATNVEAAGAIMDTDFPSSGLMKRNFSGSGSYSLVTDYSTEWNTAYNWGDHAAAGYLTAITGESITDLSDVYSSMSPSDGQVLTYDVTNGWQAEDSQGGLTWFSDAQNSTYPNTTIKVHYLFPTTAASNADIALVATGTGAILAEVPDGTATGGDKRGSYAVDFQKSRNSNTQVASGVAAGILCGRYNTASADSSAVLAGQTNTASGTYSSVIGGADNTASGTYSFAGGQNSLADALWSTSIGYGGDSRGRPVSFNIGNNYKGQTTILNVSGETTDATATKLTTYSGIGSTENLLDSNSAYAFKILVIAHVTGGGDTKAWELIGAIKRSPTTPTVSIIGSVTKNIIAADSGASSWDIDVVVNTSDRSFTVEVTGAASTTIKWNASMLTSEIAF
jgi:hypothetical protein